MEYQQPHWWPFKQTAQEPQYCSQSHFEPPTSQTGNKEANGRRKEYLETGRWVIKKKKKKSASCKNKQNPLNEVEKP